jgi:hypothetical protein
MSDTPGQPVGSDGASAPTELTEQQVMDGIEGLLDERPRRPERQTQRQQNQPQEASDVPADAEEPGPDPRPGPDDPAPSEEDDDYTPDPEDVPEGDDLADHQSVVPPSSWNKADLEVFRALPPEAQAIIARRDTEQNAAFTQKTKELSEHRQALESTFSEIQSERQSYAQNLQQLLFVAAPEAERFANVDWQRLAAEQPAEYVNLTAQRDALRGRIAGIQQELQRVSAQSQQTQQQQFAQLRGEQAQRLVEAMPDFGDATKGPKLAGDIRGWLQKQGFSDQEIGQVIDHRVILVAHKAMLADRAATARQQAETKRNTAAPAVQPPGNGRQRSDTQAAQRRAQKMSQLRRSGSEKDAISLLMDIL